MEIKLWLAIDENKNVHNYSKFNGLYFEVSPFSYILIIIPESINEIDECTFNGNDNLNKINLLF